MNIRSLKRKIMKRASYILLAFFILAIVSCGNGTNSLTWGASSSDITVGDNWFSIEADATESDLGEWELITPSHKNYFDPGPVEPINKTYLEFTGNSPSSGPATSPLEYTFTSPSTGSYRLAMRMYQRLEGEAEDKCNDVYIRMSGDFESGSEDYTTDDLKVDMKFFGRGTTTWGALTSGDGGSNHAKKPVIYNFKEGSTYTFTMSGRSQRANIDYILFFDTSLDIKVQNFKDLASENDSLYLPFIEN